MWRKLNDRDEEGTPMVSGAGNARNTETIDRTNEASFRTHGGLEGLHPRHSTTRDQRVHPRSDYSNNRPGLSIENSYPRAEGVNNRPSQAGHRETSSSGSQNDWRNVNNGRSQGMIQPNYQQQENQHRSGASNNNQSQRIDTRFDSKKNSNIYRPPQFRSQQPADRSDAMTSPLIKEESQQQVASTNVTEFWNKLSNTVRNVNRV
jgi:hypothetical protein